MTWFYVGSFNAFAAGFCLMAGLAGGGWFTILLGVTNLALAYNCGRYLKEEVS